MPWSMNLKWLRDLDQFLSSGEKWRLLGLAILNFFQLILELLGIGAVLPFATLIITPSKITESGIGGWIQGFFGFSNPGYTLMVLSSLFIFLYFFKSIFTIFLSYLQHGFFFRRWASLSHRLLQNFLCLPYDRFTERNTAILSNTVLQESLRFIYLQQNLMQISGEVMTLSGILIFLGYMAPRTTFALFSLIAIFSWMIQRASGRYIRRFGEEVTHFSGMMNRECLESLGGFKELKVTGGYNLFLEGYQANVQGFARAQSLYSTLQGIPKIALEGFAVGCLFFLVSLKSLTKMDLTLIIPELAMLGMAFFRILPSVNRLNAYITQIRFNKKSFESIIAELNHPEIASMEKEGGEPLPPFKTGITVDEVNFHYRGHKKNVLRKISLVIPKSSVVAVTGPSGSGKTTLVDILLGLLSPTNGKVLFNNEIPLTPANHDSLKKIISYVPQQFFILDGTIRKNVVFTHGRGGTGEETLKIREVLRKARLLEFIDTLPEGIDSVVGDRGVRLSGGQRQRLGLARALYREPEILILDEATSALDNITESEIMEEIFRMNRETGMTVILIAHRLSTLMNADQIYLLDKGHIVGAGSHANLLEESELYRRLHAGRERTEGNEGESARD